MHLLYMSGNKKKNKVTKKYTIVSNMKDYSKDPFVVKKVEAAKKTIEKYGLPKELLNG